MARNIRKSSNVVRGKGNKIEPKIQIIAYCEGLNTEPDYLKKFSLIHGNALVIVECVGAAGVPTTIVDSCAERVKALNKKARKSNDPLDKNFQVWAVFDRDEHHNINSAIDKANANNVKFAFSNPCFEIWPYLHFADQTAEIHRWDMQKKLEGVLNGYDRKKSKSVCAQQIYETGSYKEAKSRAERLSIYHEDIGISISERNPSTNIYKLLDLIIKNGKKAS